MASYTITVNGKSYDVIVEKKSGAAAPAAAAAPVAAPAPAAAPAAPAPKAAAPAPAPKAAPAAGGAGTISAPMPGKIIAVKVAVGDSVKKGQEVIVVEAMKMHNPVLAAGDGVVKEIYVKPGDPIQTGTPLILIG
ncbi:MAG: acetyl-CoA carboxylase biotin carboxyl carrier protein subunit [Negativicutes bacterium]|nr:acetyl-CoA carboxylase biotin carboxyl carrier protein subunit [Negativicutes bacterium]